MSLSIKPTSTQQASTSETATTWESSLALPNFHPMEKKFRRRISLLAPPPGSGVLLAVSGGPDSTAMLHLFHRIRKEFSLRLHAVHLHHGIRGAEAEADLRFVLEECRKLEIPCSAYRFDVPSWAKREKLSLEAASRRIRRHFLLRSSKANRCDFIALAHTADDQAETVLMNLLRGAGPTGLSGMSSLQTPFLRPLLNVGKQEILDFLSLHQLSYRIDSSNQDLQYLRNRTRHEVIPFLKQKFHASVQENLTKTAQILEEEEQWWESYLAPFFQERLQAISFQAWELRWEENFPVAVQRRMLRKLLQTASGSLEGFDFRHIERIRDLLSQGVGKRFELGLYVVEKTKRGLAIAKRLPLRQKKTPVKIPGETILEALQFSLEATLLRKTFREIIPGPFESKEAFLDYRRMESLLFLRFRKPGDFFIPLGSGKRKKLQDFFVDRKIPKILRDQIPLLVSGDKIAWVAGCQLDDRFKITPDTEEILHLKIHERKPSERARATNELNKL